LAEIFFDSISQDLDILCIHNGQYPWDRQDSSRYRSAGERIRSTQSGITNGPVAKTADVCPETIYSSTIIAPGAHSLAA
jgi:hypothetical protein